MRVRGGMEPRSLDTPILLPAGSLPSDLGGGAGLSHRNCGVSFRGGMKQGLLDNRAKGWDSERATESQLWPALLSVLQVRAGDPPESL